MHCESYNSELSLGYALTAIMYAHRPGGSIEAAGVHIGADAIRTKEKGKHEVSTVDEEDRNEKGPCVAFTLPYPSKWFPTMDE